MRRFCLRILLAALPVALMVVVNYTRDPAGLFGGGAEARIGALLVDGHAVRPPDEYNARLVDRYYVQHAPTPPDVVILGTSRAMRIRSSAFPGRTAMNLAVFAGTVEDVVAIVGMYDRKGRWPGEIVLVLEPWMLNDFNGLTGWRSVASEYQYMSRRLGTDPSLNLPAAWPAFDTYFALVSPAYFQAALRSRPTTDAADRVSAVPAAAAEDTIVLADGSRLDGRAIRERSAAEGRMRAVRDAAPPFAGLEHFSALSPARERELTLATRFLAGVGVRVTFALMPFHPLVHQILFSSSAYAMVGRAEQRFRALGRELGVAVRGSYDPGACRCLDTDFVDGIHPTAPCSARALTVAAR